MVSVQRAFNSLCNELGKTQQQGGSSSDVPMLLHNLSSSLQLISSQLSDIARVSSKLQPQVCDLLQAHDRFLFTAMYRDSVEDLTIAISKRLAVAQETEARAVRKEKGQAATPAEKISAKEQKRLHVDQIKEACVARDRNKAGHYPFLEQWHAAALQVGFTPTEYRLLRKFNKEANLVAHQPALKDEGLSMLGEQKSACAATLPSKLTGEAENCISLITRLYTKEIAPLNKFQQTADEARETNLYAP